MNLIQFRYYMQHLSLTNVINAISNETALSVFKKQSLIVEEILVYSTKLNM